MTTLRSGSATDAGRVRDTNEDWLLASEGLFVVADGMGGHAGGEVASRTAVEALKAGFETDPSGPGLVRAVKDANVAVWERSRADQDLRGMGTTLTAAALVTGAEGEHLTLVNVGDSRAYMLRGGELSQLTEDHTLVEEMVRSGELSAEAAAFHPQRHILTRALGIEPDVEVDAWEVTPTTGDRLLICSDGLVNEMGDSEITSVLTRTTDPGDAARELVTLARAHGGNDNITVVLIDVVEGTDGSSGPADHAVLGAAAAPPRAGEAAPSPEAAEPDQRDSSGDTGGGGNEAGRDAGDPHGVAGSSSGRDGELAASSRARAAAALLAVEPDSGPRSANVAVPSLPEQSESGPRSMRSGRRMAGHQRRITLRVLLFVAVLIAVLGGAVAAVGWFAERSYFVGLEGNQIVIFQGRPGGLLWFKPHVEQSTGVTTSEVLPARIQDLRKGTEEPSLSAARSYVRNLVNEARSTLGTAAAGGPSGTATPSGTPAQPSVSGAAP